MPESSQPDTPPVWQQRFATPKIRAMQLDHSAADRGVVISNQTGTHQIYAWRVSTGDLRQMTDRPTGVYLATIAPDGQYIYYFADHDGDEIGHYVRVPFAGGQPEDLTPTLPFYSTNHIAVSRSGHLLGFDPTTADGTQLYVVEQDSSGTLSPPKQLALSDRYAFGPALSYNGTLAVWASTERAGKPLYSLVAFDCQSGERVAELWDGQETSLVWSSFAPLLGDTRLLATSDRTGVKRPVIWNPRTQERLDLAIDQLPGDVLPLDWSPDGQRILLSHMHQAVMQLYLYDLATGTTHPLHHPTGTFHDAAFTAADEIVAIWEDATHAPQLIALHGTTGVLTRTLLTAGPEIPGQAWRSITFPSSDGVTIQGWLGVPAGDGPFPIVIHCHGGPDMVATQSFTPVGQAWLDHGFAFLTINYRGSTTFGRDFETQIWGNPGHWEVEDVVAARRWVLEQGIARDEQIFLTGWSYGGYLTLLALGTYPQLWAGGMAGSAIADWVTQYEDASETFRSYQAAFFGGTPDELPEQYRRSSPSTYVEQVTAPVLIIQARNDTRTPARPVEQYVEQMRRPGCEVEIHWFHAGHAGKSVAQQIEHQAWMVQFAQRVLDERARSSDHGEPRTAS